MANPRYTRALLEIPVAQSYARTCAHKAQLTLKVDPDIKVPYTTQSTLVIPALPTNATEADVQQFKYGVIHETLHHSEGSKFDYLSTIKKDSPLRECYGLVEDFRIEKQGTADYEGDRGVIVAYNNEARTSILGNLERGKDKFATAPGVDKLVSMMALDWEARAESGFEPNAALDVARVQSTFDGTPLGKQVSSLLDSADLVRAYRDVKTPEDAIKVAESLYKLLFKEDPETQKEPQKGKGKGDKGEGKGEGEPKPGEGEDADGDPTKGEGGKGDRPCRLEDWQRASALLGDAKRIKHEGYEFGSGVNYKGVAPGVAYGTYEEYGPSRTVVIESKDLEDKQASAAFLREYEGYSERKDSHANGMANTLRRILQVQSQAYYINNQKKGKLSTKNAYRLLIPQVGDGEWNTRVFRKKVESDVLDAAVTILVDCSGSMRGPKYVNAIDSAILLNSALSQRLHIPVEVLGFTDPARQTYLVAKQFDEKVSDNHILNAFGVFSHRMSNNADGEAILWAYHRLRPRKEKRKVLIVLSDGSPCGGPGGNIIDYTKAVIEQIEQSEDVHIVGIGIEDDSVRSFYSRTVVINDSNELSEKLLEVCRRDLFKIK